MQTRITSAAVLDLVAVGRRGEAGFNIARKSHAGRSGSSARGRLNLSRGFTRIAISLAVLWFVFWTAAYVLAPHRSENMPQDPPFAPTTDIVLMAGAVLGLPWIIWGFRSRDDYAG